MIDAGQLRPYFTIISLNAHTKLSSVIHLGIPASSLVYNHSR